MRWSGGPDGSAMRRERRGKALAIWALLAILATSLVLLQGANSSPPVAAVGGGPELTLDVTSGGFCDGSDCYSGVGDTFDLTVALDQAPAAGYVLLQTFIDYANFDPAASEDGAGPNTCGDGFDNGSNDGADRYDDDCVTVELTYVPTVGIQDEFVWPDLNPAIAFRNEPGSGLVAHAGMTGLVPPLAASSYEGAVVSVQFTCSASASNSSISILAYDGVVAATQGALLVEGDSPDYTYTTPKVDAITLHCVSKQAHPGDTDGDGCSDVTENGSNPALGGDRDWLNPWDFYDVAGPGGVPIPDGIIDLPNDILGVISHVGSAPGPPYDVQYDRGPWTGANSWNGTTPPDGVIDSPNDILGVIAQFNHSCA